MVKHKEWVDAVKRIRSDTEQRHGLIRLEKNERVTPFSESFWNTVYSQVTQDYLLAYPEPERFYQKLAEFHKLSIEHFVLTSGSDGAIRNGFELCVQPEDEVVSIYPSFAMVEIYCDLFKAKKCFIRYNKNIEIDYNELIDAINENVSLIVLANPNSPTGTLIPRKVMQSIAEKSNALGIVLMIDEAYHGFCKESCIDFVNRYNNVMITRTFSKAGGLAGARIGYIVAQPSLAQLLYRFRPMYEVNSLALLFASAVLDHQEEVEHYLNETAKGKTYLFKELARLGYPVIDTHTNFVHIDVGDKKTELLKRLDQHGIKVRGGLPIETYENYIRLSTGPISAMEAFIKQLEGVEV